LIRPIRFKVRRHGDTHRSRGSSIGSPLRDVDV
jgi:hypothetical protein